MLTCTTREKAVELFERVQGNKRALVLWMLVLLRDVVAHAAENNMDAQKLGWFLFCALDTFLLPPHFDRANYHCLCLCCHQMC